MTKEEFIKFLEEKEYEANFTPHFGRTYINSDDHWDWYVLGIDGLQPDIDLSVEGKVKFTYNKSLYDNESAIIEELKYEEFLDKFFK